MTGSESAMEQARPPLSLFGWPDRRHAAPGMLCVIGAPSDHGNVIARGPSRAPAAIRRASADLAVPRHGVDIGDIAAPKAPDPAAFLDRIAAETRRVRGEGLCPLILGGDHSITYAPVSVLQGSEELCLVWFDAHTDFSPWSGQSFHNHKQVLRRISMLEGVKRIVQIGYRGITAGDERSLGPKATVVTTSCARDLDKHALLALVPEALPCYLSIDIDVVDPVVAPGTSAPVPDGLLPEHVKSQLQALVRHRRIVGIDLVEVNPARDQEGATSRVAANLLQGVAEQWAHQQQWSAPPARRQECHAHAI